MGRHPITIREGYDYIERLHPRERCVCLYVWGYGA